MVITGKTKVKEALDKFPELKEILLEISPKFSKLNNPLIYKTVAKWATFNDVAKIGRISICLVLHKLNARIGKEEELIKIFPECIDYMDDNVEKENEVVPKDFNIITFDTTKREDYFLPELKKIINSLKEKDAVKVISTFDPIPLKRMVESLGITHNTKEINPDYYETYIYKKPDKENYKNNG